jgi:hypothetical protein
MSFLEWLHLSAAKNEIRLALCEVIGRRNNLLVSRNICKEILERIIVTGYNIRRGADFYFRLAEELKICADIQKELQLLDSDLGTWPTPTLIRKARNLLAFLRTTNTTSIEIFYFAPDSHFRTSRVSIDTDWGMFSSADKFYDHLVEPPRYEDVNYLPPSYEQVSGFPGTE